MKKEIKSKKFRKVCRLTSSKTDIYVKGGFIVPQEHREASKFIHNSGLVIIINEYPDLG